jgi:DNA mismatch endonuclease (patch repair protein)
MIVDTIEVFYVITRAEAMTYNRPSMADVLTREQRSANMAAIRGKDTKPEIVVRRLTHRLGYRYVLHGRKLPGKPDLVFPSRRRVIFVHGCFWHMHSCRFGKVVPATNADFWERKRAGNVLRDERHIKALTALGWKVLVIWECQTRDIDDLRSQICAFLRL